MSSRQAHPVKGVLATRRISIRRLAAEIGRNETHLSEVLNGYRSMTPEVAESIAAFLSVDVMPVLVEAPQAGAA